MSYPFAVLFLFSKHGLPRPMDRPPVFQHIVYRIHAKPGINKVAMLAERIVLSSRLNRFPQDTVLFTVPSFFQGRFVQIRQIRHFKVVATANSQFPVRHNPHIQVIYKYILDHPNEFKDVDILIQMRYLKEVLTNRAGSAPNKQTTGKIIKETCLMPYTDMWIMPNGKLGICCCDNFEIKINASGSFSLAYL